MNLNFLVEYILPTRKEEIQKGKNLATSRPIYVVLDLQETYCQGHSYFSYSTLNHKNVPEEHGYVDAALDSEDRKFAHSPNGMKKPEEITRFYVDEFVAFFLTSQSAHDYLQYQSHNLRNEYVYVFHAGYRNWEMESLLSNEE